MLVHRALSDAAHGRLKVQFHSPEITALQRDMQRHQRRTLLGITGGALLISGAVLLSAGALPGLAILASSAGAALLAGAWL